MPDKATVWGLVIALSEILRVATREPFAVGVIVILTVQVRPAPRVPPHVVPD